MIALLSCGPKFVSLNNISSCQSQHVSLVTLILHTRIGVLIRGVVVGISGPIVAGLSLSICLNHVP